MEVGEGKESAVFFLPLVLLRRALPLYDQFAGDLPGGGHGEELGLALNEKERNTTISFFLFFVIIACRTAV